jgi:hypothetical protein
VAEKLNARSFVVTRTEVPGKAGAICFITNNGNVVGFNHCCPCGCGKWSFVRLNRELWSPDTEPFWERTGPDDRMTLTPSIGIHPIKDGQYHWHGYLRDGLFEEC